MNLQQPLNRRAFAKATVAAVVTAASGLSADTARSLAATAQEESVAGRPGELIDTNVTLGRWPFRRVSFDETPALVKKLRRNGVTQAWAGTFDGLFHKDLAAANARLSAECRLHGRGLLLPFGSVNLTLRGWEDDLRRCAEVHGMRGVRLHPAYHGYRFEEPAFARLLGLAQERHLIVQIVADMEDERTQHPLARVPHPDFKPLPGLLQAHATTRVLLLNWFRAISSPLVQQLANAGVCFDIATLENVGGVARLIQQVSPQRVVFGSYAPLFYFESADLKLKESALSSQWEHAVRSGNAQRLRERV